VLLSYATLIATLIANISGTTQHIQNRKDIRTTKILPGFDEKSPVKFGPHVQLFCNLLHVESTCCMSGRTVDKLSTVH